LYTIDVGNCPENRLIENDVVETVFDVYPNPSNGLFYVDLPNQVAEEQFINVYDVTGRVLRSYAFASDNETLTIPIDLEDVSSGMYFVEWRTATQHLTERIIIE